MFLVGPKIEILDSFVNGMGQYIGSFVPDALAVNAYGIIVGSEVGDYFIGHGLLHGLLLSVYLLPASPKEERFGNFCLE